MFCPNCGRNVPDNQAFCDGCGTPLAAPPRQGQPSAGQAPAYQAPYAPAPTATAPTATAPYRAPFGAPPAAAQGALGKIEGYSGLILVAAAFIQMVWSAWAGAPILLNVHNGGVAAFLLVLFTLWLPLALLLCAYVFWKRAGKELTSWAGLNALGLGLYGLGLLISLIGGIITMASGYSLGIYGFIEFVSWTRFLLVIAGGIAIVLAFLKARSVNAPTAGVLQGAALAMALWVLITFLTFVGFLGIFDWSVRLNVAGAFGFFLCIALLAFAVAEAFVVQKLK